MAVESNGDSNHPVRRRPPPAEREPLPEVVNADGPGRTARLELTSEGSRFEESGLPRKWVGYVDALALPTVDQPFGLE